MRLDIMYSCLPASPISAAAFLSAAISDEDGIEDRISALPNGLLRDVVSRLPVKDAARTNALCRRWRGLWRAIPLVLDDAHCHTPKTGTVVEYTAAFWEHLHRVLDLNSNLTIKSFIHQYVDGLREDIQAVVRLRSPSSITSASVLARIREEEIGKDTMKGADKLGISDGHMPTEILAEVFPEPAAPCRAGQSVSTIDVSYRSVPTPTTYSMECLGSDATIDVLPKIIASAESDEDLDTVSVSAVTPSTCSTGGLAHGHEVDSLAAVSLVLWTATPSSKDHAKATPTESQRPFSVHELDTMVSTRCSTRCFDDDIAVLTLTFKLDVNPSNMQQGQTVRPWPWPSFVDRHRSTARGSIIKTLLCASKTSSGALVLCSTLPLLTSGIECYMEFGWCALEASKILVRYSRSAASQRYLS
ncbi:hypothetical protein QYE76_063386 [Lolium multiflorum]|uniref:F-box domain-containing protein n=1 Tax=Lolium multiflorum TaxID=4521 RepID=A0AAD8S624_LOLMU|nr:hypothetical protein QYE76_063386 [Lolium multiflorum]